MTRNVFFHPRLPAELDLCIIEAICNDEDSACAVQSLYSLVRTSRDHYHTLLPALYRVHERWTKNTWGDRRVTYWAVSRDRRATMDRVLEFTPGLWNRDNVRDLIKSRNWDYVDRLLDLETVQADMVARTTTTWMMPDDRTPNDVVQHDGSLSLLRRIVDIMWPGSWDTPERDHSDGPSSTILEDACGRGRPDIVRFLLDRGYDPDEQGGPHSSSSALGAAIHENCHVVRQVPRESVIGTYVYTDPFPRDPQHVENSYEIVRDILDRAPALANPSEYVRLAAHAGCQISSPVGNDMLHLVLGYGLPFPTDQDTLDVMLHEAIFSSNMEQMRLLLDRGASTTGKVQSLGRPYSSPITALQAVALSRQFHRRDTSVSMLDMLVAHGAEMEHPHHHLPVTPLGDELRFCKEEQSPLRLALETNDIPLVERFLELGVHNNPKQLCPLYFVQSVEAVVLLESHGLDINEQGADGSYPLIQLTLNCRSPDTFQHVVDAVHDVNVTDRQGRTALSYSVIDAVPDLDLRWQETSRLDMLLGRQPDMQKPDLSGQTPLHHAAIHGSPGAVDHLISHRADANARDNEGFTPLHRALETQHDPAIELNSKHKGHSHDMLCRVQALLLRGRADPDARSHNGTYALHIPRTPWFSISDMERLLEMYAVVKGSRDPHRHGTYTCPDMPDCRGREISKEPYQRPCTDAQAVDLMNRTDRGGRLRLVEELSTKTPSLGMASPDVPAPFGMDQLERFIALGGDVNATDANGTTPLMATLKGACSATRDYLLDHGADINAQDSRGRTVLDRLDERRGCSGPPRGDQDDVEGEQPDDEEMTDPAFPGSGIFHGWLSLIRGHDPMLFAMREWDALLRARGARRASELGE